MNVELHQLDLRYEKLRTHKPEAERKLVGSLAAIGQQVPVVVVHGDGPERFVLVDGYKRVRALRRLGHDLVGATCWDLSEAEALVLDRLMRTGEGATALEQGWLLHELSVRFALSLEDLGRRFARSASWVSRRLALVEELPEAIQARVQRGELPAHAAMKYLVPLARANADACTRLVAVIAGQGLTNREVGQLYAAWREGRPAIRERVLTAPLLFLKARHAVATVPDDEGRAVMDDLDLLAAVARRARRRLRQGLWPRLLPPERQEVRRLGAAAHEEMARLAEHLHEEEEPCWSKRSGTRFLNCIAAGRACAPSRARSQVSRAAVRDVLRRGSAEVPRLARAEKALDHRDDIQQLLQQCEGSFMRVHEELTKRGLQLSYPALTAFCRRHGIGHVPKLPAGRYDFAPGQEMQHDTSPHDLHLGGKLRRVQTASLVLAYSRMLFFQFYPQFRRFEDKVFLTEALRYMDGACQTCMIDNTHVVVLKGTGAAMIPVPEMAAFAERFGFTFVAHAVGDANRSGRVERMFRFIERGFLPGRRFTDWTDANRQARAWCDRVNARPKRQLKATPRELFAAEHPGPAPAAPLDPRAVSAPSATRRRRGLRHAAHQSLLRAQRAHRPAPRRARARRSRRHLRRPPRDHHA